MNACHGVYGKRMSDNQRKHSEQVNDGVDKRKERRSQVERVQDVQSSAEFQPSSIIPSSCPSPDPPLNFNQNLASHPGPQDPVSSNSCPFSACSRFFQAFKPEKRSTPRHSAHFASSPLKRRRSPFGRSRLSHKSDHHDDSARNETTLVNEHHQDADDPDLGEQEAFDSDDTFFIWSEEKTLFSDLMGDKWARIVQFIALVQHLFQCKGTGRRRACCPC